MRCVCEFYSYVRFTIDAIDRLFFVFTKDISFLFAPTTLSSAIVFRAQACRRDADGVTRHGFSRITYKLHRSRASNAARISRAYDSSRNETVRRETARKRPQEPRENAVAITVTVTVYV